MRIAVLLTCYNRCKKTQRCLESLVEALRVYNKCERDDKAISIEIYLTDDGCTDGTAEAARMSVNDVCPIHIIQGKGDLCWAGGMRLCWREAIKRHSDWDYYLLLNDDVELLPQLFKELLKALDYSRSNFGKVGLVSGTTCSIDKATEMTYGGYVWKNKLFATYQRVIPYGEPQICDLTNANVLLVPKTVVDKIGIFYEGYRHGKADFDYSNKARKAGIPVVITASFCGKCDHDHNDYSAEAQKVMAMNLNERKRYFNHPLHSINDYLTLVRRMTPLRLPIVMIGRFLNVYFPKFYYRMSGVRF